MFILDDSDEDEYLLNPRKKIKLSATTSKSTLKESEKDLLERAEIIKQKFEQRKLTKKSNTDRKKLKIEKLNKKMKVQNRKKIMTNEILKQERASQKVTVKEDPDKAEKVNGSAVYNKEGKMFFSKIQIEGEKKKKVVDTNPRNNLMKLKAQKKKIQDLVGSGDKMKAKEEKQKILWKSAFEKTDGLKVKDNVEILKKTIKKRKVEKKKSKKQWGERKEKVKEKQATQQKKREDNLNKRKTDNQKNKLKHAVKKGRMIKGVSG